MRIFLIVLLTATALARPAAAQTARIAHLSHSGSAATLDEAVGLDNFGELMPYFKADSIRLLSDTTALAYGEWQYVSRYREKADFYSRKTDTLKLGSYATEKQNERRELVRYYQRYHSDIKLIGFDTAQAPVKAVPPVKMKQKTKRRRAAVGLMLSGPGAPTQPGRLLLLAGALVMAGAGWLLGGRNPESSYSA